MRRPSLGIVVNGPIDVVEGFDRGTKGQEVK